jgi:hypothetical protein
MHVAAEQKKNEEHKAAADAMGMWNHSLFSDLSLTLASEKMHQEQAKQAEMAHQSAAAPPPPSPAVVSSTAAVVSAPLAITVVVETSAAVVESKPATVVHTSSAVVVVHTSSAAAVIHASSAAAVVQTSSTTVVMAPVPIKSGSTNTTATHIVTTSVVHPSSAPVKSVVVHSSLPAAPPAVSHPVPAPSSPPPVLANTTVIHSPAPTVSASFKLVGEKAKSTIMQQVTPSTKPSVVEQLPVKATHTAASVSEEKAAKSMDSAGKTSAVAISAVEAVSSTLKGANNSTPTAPAASIKPTPEPVEQSKPEQSSKTKDIPASSETPKQDETLKPAETPKQEGASEAEPVAPANNNAPDTEVVEYPTGFLVGRRRQLHGL